MEKFTVDDLEKKLIDELASHSKEYRRAFHGRGECYEGFEFLIVDFIDTTLYIAFYSSIDEQLEKELLELFKRLYEKQIFKAVILQRRYLQQQPNQVLFGMLPTEVVAFENELKYQLNMVSNQNIGFFADMKEGRAFVKDEAKDKNVLNLFSYTCAFSVSALAGNASKVVNVDMAKGALTTGRHNHHINDLDTKKVKFLPYNILKSWNRIQKEGPYDLIIIDPPSFQKGSFAASKDYIKIIKRLDKLASKTCTVLACLNAPELTTQFLKEIFQEHAPSFDFTKRLDNPKEFPSVNKERSLKNLIFTRCFHE